MSLIQSKNEHDRRARAVLVRANDLFQEKRYEEAIEVARSAPPCDDAELQGMAQNLIGRCFYYLDDLPAAEAAYLKSLKFYRWPGTYVFLSTVCELTDRDDDALSYLQQVLEIDNDYDEAHYLIGRQYREREQFPRAEKHLRRAIELDENYHLAMTELAECLLLQHHYDESKSWLEKALVLAPDCLWSGVWYAHLLWRLDEIAQADKAYLRVLEFWPNESITNWTYADFLSSELNNPALAEEYFAKALEIDSKDQFTHCYIGKHWLRRGDIDQAITHLSIAAGAGHEKAQKLLSEITSG